MRLLSIFRLHTNHPLGNRGHIVWMDYKQKNPKFARNHLGNWFYHLWGPFSIITHKSYPLENGGHIVWVDYKQKVPKFARNHQGNGFYEVLLPLLHTKYPLGKRGPYSLNGLQAKKFKICTKPLRQWVLWGPFSIIIHKSPPWKTGATQFEWITSNQLRILHETTMAMGFMRLFFHYYTQITPWKTEATQF